MLAQHTERLRITSMVKSEFLISGKFVAGAGDDLQIYHDGSNSFIQNELVQVSLVIRSDVKMLKLLMPLLTNFSVQMATLVQCRIVYYGNSRNLKPQQMVYQITGQIDIGTTSIYGTGDISMGDSDKLRLGGGDDLRIYHDGSINRIRSDVLRNVIERMIVKTWYHSIARSDGAVSIISQWKYKNSETTSTGASVTGNLNVSGHVYLNDDREVVIGAGQDLKLYHDSATGDSFIKETGSGNLKLVTSTFIRNAADTEHIIWANQDAEVRLYHNNVKKLETTTTGAKITGALEVTQEYPSIRPILDLNFAATKTLDRRITFSREVLELILLKMD